MGVVLLELFELFGFKLWTIIQRINRHMLQLQMRIGLRIIHPLEFNMIVVAIAAFSLSFSDIGLIKQEEVPPLMAFANNLGWFLLFSVMYHQTYKWLVRKYRKQEEETVVSQFFRCFAQAALLKSILLMAVGVIFLGQGEYSLALVEARSTIYYMLSVYILYAADEYTGGVPPKKRRQSRAHKVSALEALRQRILGVLPQVR